MNQWTMKDWFIFIEAIIISLLKFAINWEFLIILKIICAKPACYYSVISKMFNNSIKTDISPMGKLFWWILFEKKKIRHDILIYRIFLVRCSPSILNINHCVFLGYFKALHTQRTFELTLFRNILNQLIIGYPERCHNHCINF